MATACCLFRWFCYQVSFSDKIISHRRHDWKRRDQIFSTLWSTQAKTIAYLKLLKVSRIVFHVSSCYVDGV